MSEPIRKSVKIIARIIATASVTEYNNEEIEIDELDEIDEILDFDVMDDY